MTDRTIEVRLGGVDGPPDPAARFVLTRDDGHNPPLEYGPMSERSVRGVLGGFVDDVDRAWAALASEGTHCEGADRFEMRVAP